MALLWALAVVACVLIPRLQNRRIKRGIAHEAQSSGHSEDGDMNAVAYDGKLLACEHVEEKERFIIQSEDKPFLDYYFDVGNYLYEEAHETSTINCKTFTSPPKPSSILKNLTTPTLPEDVIDLIAARFKNGVQCESCRRTIFNMTFFERCRTALAQNQWYRVQSEVVEEGGSCEPSEGMNTSANCRSPLSCLLANPGSVCCVQSAADNLSSIKDKERRIKDHEDAIQGHEELIREIQEGQEFSQATAGEAFNELVKDSKMMKEVQELINQRIKNQHPLDRAAFKELFKDTTNMKEVQEVIKKEIKKKQKAIRYLQDAVDMLKQNMVYVKQIFEGL